MLILNVDNYKYLIVLYLFNWNKYDFLICEGNILIRWADLKDIKKQNKAKKKRRIESQLLFLKKRRRIRFKRGCGILKKHLIQYANRVKFVYTFNMA
jgi:hypothetical protein